MPNENMMVSAEDGAVLWVMLGRAVDHLVETWEGARREGARESILQELCWARDWFARLGYPDALSSWGIRLDSVAMRPVAGGEGK